MKILSRPFYLDEKFDGKTILEYILDPSIERITLEGYTVKVTSVRLMTFATTGLACVSCGIKADYFEVNDNTSGAHINLYGVTKLEIPVLMTKDHIRPKCHGGSDRLDNMQTMCLRCNNAKGSKWIEEVNAGFFRNTLSGNADVIMCDAIKDLKSLIDKNIELHGENSPIKPLLIGDVQSLKDRLNLEKSINPDDESSISIMEYAKHSRARRKMKQYVRSVYFYMDFVKDAVAHDALMRETHSK